MGGRELLETWFRRVWKEEDVDAIDEMFPFPGEAKGLGAQSLIGPEDFKQFHGALCTLLSDIDICIDKCIEEGVWTSALCTLHATSKNDGSQVKITGTVFGRIEDGKIQEAYNHWDFLELWSQMGYLPSDSFEKGLKGQQVI